MKIPFGKPLIGEEEIEAVNKVLHSPMLVHGPLANEFENMFADFVGAKGAVSVSSCTAGMHLVYMSLGLGQGDEVIVPAQTHIATAHAIEITGAKAVFVDVDKHNGNIDINNIEKHINSNTKAIAVVHYLGVPAEMNEIKKIANKYNLFVLEDCALAPGTILDSCHAGLHGDVGVFSFYPVKHITTAEGGIVISKHQDLLKKIKHLKAFGLDRNYLERKVPGLYDVTELGLNYRMSEIHAAIGIEQIKKLPIFLNLREENFNKLFDHFKELPFVRVLPQFNHENSKSSYYCLGLILDHSKKNKREFIMSQLTSKGIGTSIYYPNPVPRMQYYQVKYRYDSKKYINAETISDSIISFPVGPHLTIKDMDFIGEQFKLILENLDV